MSQTTKARGLLMDEAPRTGKRLIPVTEAERHARRRLAACYRVFDYLGWTESIFNHITLRVPGPETVFLINPFGLHYSEVTASNLVAVDIEGHPVRPAEHPINLAGFVTHSAIHGHIPKAHCVMHTHTTTGRAVACLEEGLSHDTFYGAQLYGRVAYHEFEGVTVEPDERERMTRRFGVLYQSGALWSSMTLAENVALPLEQYTTLTPAEIADLVSLKLALVGLAGFEEFYPSEISGGMCKRAGLARAMALDPDILFFDEPSAGLDPISAAELDERHVGQGVHVDLNRGRADAIEERRGHGARRPHFLHAVKSPGAAGTGTALRARSDCRACSLACLRAAHCLPAGQPRPHAGRCTDRPLPCRAYASPGVAAAALRQARRTDPEDP